MSDPDLDEALGRAVEARFESEQVPFLARLVEQPSCSREPEDVELAAKILDERAEGLGLRTTRLPDPDGFYADHRLYQTEGTGPDDASLGLVGHVDTVFPREMGFFGFERDGDTAHGPGVLDMKSGLSSIFFALEAVREVTGGLSFPLRVIVNSDEEVGSRSSHAHFGRLAPSLREALVFEAGRARDEIVIRRKGTGSFQIIARGRAAHAGLAHADGVNAIEALALVLPKVGELTDYDRGLTFNVGLVRGGSSANTVPAEARCDIDSRLIDPADDPRGVAALERVVAEAELPARLAGATLELKGLYHRPPMVDTHESRELMRRYGAQAVKVGLSDQDAPLQGGGSDANLLAAAGVPVIDGLGPSGSGIHRTDERCSLDSLRRRTIALARFLAAEHGL